MKTAIAVAFGLYLGTWLGFALGGSLSPAQAQAGPLSTTHELARIASALERIESKCCNR